MQFLFLLILYQYRKLLLNSAADSNSDKALFFLLVASIAIVLTNIFHHVGLLVRIVHYFTIFIPIAIPLLVDGAFRGNNRLIVYMGFILVFFMLFLKGIYSDVYHIFPYSTYL
jgi:hypothetical protein